MKTIIKLIANFMLDKLSDRAAMYEEWEDKARHHFLQLPEDSLDARYEQERSERFKLMKEVVHEISDDVQHFLLNTGIEI